MRPSALVAAVLMLVSCVAHLALGQAPSLQPGTPVRLTVQSTSSYSLSSVSRLEVTRGHRSHALGGAGVGFLVGAGVTYLLLNSGGSTTLCDRAANQDAIGSGECLGLAALGGVGGAGLRAIIGGLVRTERWQDVPIERLRVSLGPQGAIRFGWLGDF